MAKGSYARSGGGRVSKSSRARSGDVNKAVPAVLPDAASSGQGVPSAMQGMGSFARGGNENMIPTAVAVQTGLASIGPERAASVARSGGQVRLAPGQVRAWAHPRDPSPKASPQYSGQAKVSLP